MNLFKKKSFAQLQREVKALKRKKEKEEAILRKKQEYNKLKREQLKLKYRKAISVGKGVGKIGKNFVEGSKIVGKGIYKASKGTKSSRRKATNTRKKLARYGQNLLDYSI